MEKSIILLKTNTIEQNSKLWAEFIDKDTPSKQGIFINFKETPELEKPYIDYLVKNYNYVLEKPFFLRKP